MIDLGELSDVLFTPEGFQEVHVRLEGGGWATLFNLMCDLFSRGCTRTARDRRATFDDLMHVKERMRQCQVRCDIDEVVFPPRPIPVAPTTVYRAVQGSHLSSSFLEVVGVALFVVRFTPAICTAPAARAGCT